MTPVKSTLILNRLVIFQDDHTAYDEEFHEGTNIIYGDNGGGKSSILNLIFYGLGGDLKEWKPEMLLCTSVVAEVSINGNKITLKREIRANAKRPMSIYYGNISDALKSNVQGWKSFSYSRSEKKKSFSQELFDLLGYPEMRSEFESNITMHQLLRLIYVDQNSPTDSLFIREDFDSPLVRKGVGEFLLGIYDDELYDLELEKKQLTRELENTKTQLKNFKEILNQAEISNDSDKINGEISLKRGKLEKIRKSIDKLNNQKKDDNKNEEKKSEIETIKEEIIPLKKELTATLEEKEELEYEISDSELFIENLKSKLEALEQSEVVEDQLNYLDFEFCPKCLKPLEDQNDLHICNLCKSTIGNDSDQYNLIRQQIKHQIEESNLLLDVREEELRSANNRLPEIRQAYSRLQKKLDEISSKAKSTRNERLDNLYEDKGFLESSIESLTKQLRLTKIISQLESKEQELAANIERINTKIGQKHRQKSKRKDDAYSQIEKHVKYLVSKDLEVQQAFMSPKSVGIHFYDNTFSLNGTNQFSASSMTYLKKSIALGIFFSSKELEFFRFPRFLMIDNIEDKGMQDKRTENFQEVFVEKNERIAEPNQLIFSTSDLSPNLDKSKYCVGEYYETNNKSLNVIR